ncbi:MAG TPA: hypothetical protein DD381_13965 [Lentisphaeria bacterium]|nr:MAG: hypothetical protein A2X47_02410 [Lentisphaerae bacterium GWF2_38_69]HBM17429.1 hypothetical protein [Lentisphaeria bacterium]
MSLKKITVQVTDNALHKYENCSVNEALLQVIWNSIDAEADNINVDIEKVNDPLSIDKCNPFTIPAQVIITDNGEGIPFDKLENYLSQLEDSWKRKNTRKNGRKFHGRKGCGRFKYFAIGEDIIWETTYLKENEFFTYSFALRHKDPKNFTLIASEVKSKAVKTGTTVTIKNLKDKAINFFNRNIEKEIIEGLILYLEISPSLQIKIDNKIINSKDYIDDTDDGFFYCEFDELGKFKFSYKFIAWRRDLDFNEHKHTFAFDSHENFVYQYPSGINAGQIIPFHTILIASNFFDNFDEYNYEFKNISNVLKKAYREKLLQFLFKVKHARANEEFKGFLKGPYYPFSNTENDPIVNTEKNLYNLCAFSILENDNKVLTSRTHSITLLFKLLRKLIDKDINIADNLAEILELNDEEAENFKSICKSSSLPAIINHYKKIVHRLTFLETLETLVHEDSYKEKLKERTQLHKIIERETWIFGKEYDYDLITSDQSIYNVIRKLCQFKDISQEEYKDIERFVKENSTDSASCLKKIPDLVMFKRFPEITGNKYIHLIVELKAPAVPINSEMRFQAESVYNGLCNAQGNGVEISDNNKWIYYLLSSKIFPDVERYYQNRETKNLYSYQGGNFKVYCKTWREVIDSAKFRLNEEKNNLEIEIKRHNQEDLLQEYKILYNIKLNEEVEP